MKGGVAPAMASPLLEWWRWLRNPAFWMPVADGFAVLTALSLPWSTSLVGIFSACWIGSAALIVDYPAYFRSLKHPICALPLALFALAGIGTLWSEATWAERFHALGPALKLLFLPGLFHYFERSSRGTWVLVAFLVSCTLLMIMSWLVIFEPSLTLKQTSVEPGLFVKNHIAQGQEFALCAMALAYPIYQLHSQKRVWPALLLSAVALGLLANMIFVITSRTALVTLPVMLVMFALLHLRWRTSLILFGSILILSVLSWFTSPQLQYRVQTLFTEYQSYKEEDAANSIGLRLEFWRKSLGFVSEAPLLGHGTGSTRQLFERAAAASADSASGNVVSNPHNQTLNVAVQWGILGVVVLWAMWLAHLLLFRAGSFVAWIGLLVVAQNIFSSLFNSHIFDFHEGWIYVLGVGVAGGMVLKERAHTPTQMPVKG